MENPSPDSAPSEHRSPPEELDLSKTPNGPFYCPSKRMGIHGRRQKRAVSKYSSTLVIKLSRRPVPTWHNQSSVLGGTDCPRLRSRSSRRNFKKLGIIFQHMGAGVGGSHDGNRNCAEFCITPIGRGSRMVFAGCWTIGDHAIHGR